MLQKTLILILIIPSIGWASPCTDARKDYEFAKKYGAYSFYCKNQYDGTATSSWKMSREDYLKFKEALTKSKMRKSK